MTQSKEWPFKEAERIVKRLEKLGKNQVIAQTGFGPSGLPHIGTFGEVARTTFVLQALRILAPSVKFKLVSFSDDLDGLRDIPSNLPNAKMLKDHLGKPLTSIPDPFGKEQSFAHYMNNKLREFLDSFGFEYEFASSTEKYRSGVFNEGLRRVFNRRVEITELFTKTISEAKRETWSPFFPICQQCGKIYSTQVTKYNEDNYSISYSCANSLDGRYDACGYKGETSILYGGAKVGWKVDWALRWFALEVDYEMHGEDLMESNRLSSKLVREIGGKPPELFKYELFLDEQGAKISKKIGNGISIDQWLKYAPVDSLIHFMYVKPQKSKRMGLSILPKIVDSYLELMAKQGEKKTYSPVTFVKRLSKGTHASSIDHENVVTYSLIYNLVLAIGEADHGLVRNYLLKYQPRIESNIEYYDDLIEGVIHYYTEYYMPNKVEESPDGTHDEGLREFYETLKKLSINGSNLDADQIQSIAFQTAKSYDYEMKEWFKYLYQVLLGQSTGPKIGSFIALIGIRKALDRLSLYFEQ